MEKRSCFREFFRYTMLSILGTLGVSCYILAYTFFVSVGLGTKGLAALNLAIPVYNFIPVSYTHLVKEIGYKFAHHLTGVVLIVVRERQLFIVVK